MAGAQEILQEYLVSLGFKTDQVSLRRFEDHLGMAGKKVLNVGTAVVGMVAAVEAATAAFAYSMRKTYFASELANTSVKNLNALSYAGKQFGISSDAMGSALHGMAQALRLNPGLVAYASALTGVNEAGRKTDDVLSDLIETTRKMPEYQGTAIMQMFGIDPDTYHLMMDHMDEIKHKKQEMLDMYKASGVDPDQAAAILTQYAGALDKLEMRFEVIGQKLLISLAPSFNWITQKLDEMLAGTTGAKAGGPVQPRVDKDTGKIWVQHGRGGHWEEPPAGTVDRKWITARGGRGGNAGHWEYFNAVGGATPSTPTTSPPAAPSAPVTGGSNAAQTLNNLESQYNLPSGLLDSVWQQESGRGVHMRSKAGAKGHFQFMDSTAKQYGVNNPDDFGQSASGAARMYSYLLKKYRGNTQAALAAYNWGEGNYDKYLSGQGRSRTMPKETRDYVASVTARMNGSRLGANGGGGNTNVVTQSNTIYIKTTDPTAAGKEVGKEIGRTWADATRNVAGSHS